jgi:hypothetical protein
LSKKIKIIVEERIVERHTCFTVLSSCHLITLQQQQ